MKTPPTLCEADGCLAGSTARLLAACASTLGALALACAALAAAGLLLRVPGLPAAWLLAVLAATPVERVLALRLRFDAGLFADLARARSPQPVALAALDQALQTLRLRGASTNTRALAERTRGAQRLMAWHAGCVALQFAGLVAATATGAWA